MTAAVVDPEREEQPFTVTVTEYVPEEAVVAPEIDGFWRLEVNPFGPVHVYVAPATVEVASWSDCPAQIGPLFDAAGAGGMAFTTAAVVPASDTQPMTVTVTLYVPVADAAAPAIDGFWRLDVNPFGPVQA